MPHTIYRRGEIWHYRGTVAGRRLRGSCGTSDKALAQRIAAEAESRAWKGHLDGPAAHVTFAQAAIAYRQAEKPTRFLAKIEDHWRDTKLTDITAGAIRQSAIQICPKGKGATRNRQVIVPTCAIINHAARLGWCSPIKPDRFNVDAKSKPYATAAWVDAFAAQARADGLPHTAALCLFMFGTAARLGEAVRLRWADVDLNRRTAILTGMKPKPWSRAAHLPPPVLAALANIGGNRKPDALVFGYAGGGSVKYVWDNVISRAGIERMTPHSCRHGFATAALRAGLDPKTVAKLGGWQDVATVMRFYAHAMDDATLSDAVFGTTVDQPRLVGGAKL
jgi:integrase